MDKSIWISVLIRGLFLGCRLRLPLWGYCPACRLERMVESVGDESARDEDHAEGERTHPKNRLMLAAEYGETEQEHRRDADRDRSEEASRDLEWTLQRRLAETEHGQRHEFKEQAAAVDQDVERDETLETQQQARHPEAGENDDRHPRSLRLGMQLSEKFRQDAVLRHGQRQTRVAHDQGVEHAKAADHSAKGQAESEERAT